MRNHSVLFLALGLLLCSGCLKKPEDLILFSSSRNGNSDIFSMRPDGTEVTQLTFSKNEEWAPMWQGPHRISYLRQDGDTIRRISMDLSTQYEIVIPQPKQCILDDKNALFIPGTAKEVYSCNSDIFLYDPDSRETLNLTASLDGQSRYPSLGPEGGSVVFTNNQEGHNNIYQIILESGQIRPLTNTPFNDERGEISPDGKWLVYSSDREEKGNQDIWVVGLEGEMSMNISNSPGTELIARWAADGKTLYYGSNKDGNWEIYRYALSEKSTKRLTFNEGFDGDPRVFMETGK